MTGVCVEQREQTIITNPATGYSETTVSLIELRETSLWGNNVFSGGSSEFPTFIVLTAVGSSILLMVIATVLYKRKQRSQNL